ncbi:MAG: tetratricopeptide repeat protein, partial [Umezawaea sp.]
ADAVLAQLSTGRRLLGGIASTEIRTRLHVALADLHNLAGWILFDLGRAEAARAHFDSALELAVEAGNDSLAANVHYRLGRVFLHHGALREALREFEASGQVAAGSGLELAIVDANLAWTHAKMGASSDATRLLARARENFAEADAGAAPDWARFFTANDLVAMVGTVHADLAEAGDLAHVEDAAPALLEAIDGYPEDMARSRVFCLISLSTTSFLAGEVEEGIELGRTAVREAIPIRSARTADRMRPLLRVAREHDGARGLVELIEEFGATA